MRFLRSTTIHVMGVAGLSEWDRWGPKQGREDGIPQLGSKRIHRILERLAVKVVTHYEWFTFLA
jgi:hypothetical protein